MSYDGLVFQCPQQWEDITDQVEGDDVPLSFADSDSGVGALQFTVAQYVDGEEPQFDAASLHEMLQEYADNFQLGTPIETFSINGKLNGVTAAFHSADDFVCFWFLANGSDLVMATYNCEWESRDVERHVVDSIIATVECGDA